MMARETRALIDLDALAHNLETLRIAFNKEIFGVVKANAYGHDDVICGKKLLQEGVPLLCVSSMDEAIGLYEEGVRDDILIFSYVNPNQIKEDHHSNFIYTISSWEWFQRLMDENLSSLRVHLEINTGMNRTGIKERHNIETILSSSLCIEGIYTHFQSPDNLEEGRLQLSRFKTFYESLNMDFKWVHVGNAPSILVRDELWINAARLGLALYGYRVDINDLRPVLSLESKICHIDTVHEGETIGYDYTYAVERDEQFGTMPIGYADNFDVRNTLVPVYVHNKPYDIVGKICMDQTMIRIDEQVKFGDSVELIGPNRTCERLSKAMGVSIYIILSSLSTRIRREIKNTETKEKDW